MILTNFCGHLPRCVLLCSAQSRTASIYLSVVNCGQCYRSLKRKYIQEAFRMCLDCPFKTLTFILLWLTAEILPGWYPPNPGCRELVAPLKATPRTIVSPPSFLIQLKCLRWSSPCCDCVSSRCPNPTTVTVTYKLYVMNDFWYEENLPYNVTVWAARCNRLFLKTLQMGRLCKILWINVAL